MCIRDRHELDQSFIIPEAGKAMLAGGDNSLDSIGSARSYVWYKANWAEAGSAPFRSYKSFPTEGGTRVVSFLSYPAHARTGIEPSYVSVRDVVPTLLDLAQVRLEQPGEYSGRAECRAQGPALATPPSPVAHPQAAAPPGLPRRSSTAPRPEWASLVAVVPRCRRSWMSVMPARWSLGRPARAQPPCTRVWRAARTRRASPAHMTPAIPPDRSPTPPPPGQPRLWVGGGLTGGGGGLRHRWECVVKR